jgi:putative ABC transport system substrate-binding protein
LPVQDIKRAVVNLSEHSNGGFIAPPDATVIALAAQVTSLAAQYRVPAIYFDSVFATGGGLISYGPDRLDQYRRAAGYVDRILKGEKPADLPVQAPTKYEMTINLKTAKALGLTIPETLLATADEVIQ